MRLIVAGIPRCGTTYLYASIIGREMNDLDSYNGCVIKTHSLAPYRMGGINCYKAIFLFSDPLHAVISTKRNIYDRFHFENCGCFRNPDEVDIFHEDALGYEKMFDSWMLRSENFGYPVLALKYEAIPKYQKDIEEFIRQEIKWLPWIERESNYDLVMEDEFDDIKYTYGELYKKIKSAREIEIFQ